MSLAYCCLQKVICKRETYFSPLARGDSLIPGKMNIEIQFISTKIINFTNHESD